VVYLNAQKKMACELGIECCIKELPLSISQRGVEREISRLNDDDSVTGIIIHTPVPKNIDIEILISQIAPQKDAEGLNPSNIGRLAYEKWTVAPCTASACMALIDSSGVKLNGKEAVIVGHSAIVGKPLSMMLLSRLATTTVCHIGTYERGLLEEHVKKAEVLIVAVGKSRLIKGNWIKKGAIVIDVGINKNGDEITGDVDYDAASKRAAYITPVPGGVGPVTTVMLMKNLVELYKARSI
jgi:methylenetetrahydrofolate dehydrogenase (NADP+) / methenyltetrahydrofolate cyclohydrolase